MESYASQCMKQENYSIFLKSEMRKNIIPTPATETVLLDKSRVAQDMGLRLVPFFFHVCDEVNRKAIIEFLFNDNTTPSIWFHNQNHYPMEMFTESEYLYYEYCNYKPYKELVLKDNKFHQENANKVNKIRKK
jgi:hypothetical protein